ncbi:MAG: N-acetylmuramoyl-L-alanine amidase [Endozoicomonas sp. (ex Botrylloides leachii)]|nr:N-acetylmuramoyl-L-alanine amidase [Endozoicomonas sp. (ex Botrylloides leachii)]
MALKSGKTLTAALRLFFKRKKRPPQKIPSETALINRRRFLAKTASSFYLLFSLSVLKTELAWAAMSLISGVRLWRSPDKTRLVFDVSTAVTHSEFTLPNPRRLVIDIKDTTLKTTLTSLRLKNTPIRRVRHGIQHKTSLRIVLDLSGAVTTKSFLLKPNATYGYRLVVDLFDKDKKEQTPTVKNHTDWRNIVVAIDAGHGGEDPGAIGYGGGYEKTVTLAIAKKLEALLKKAPGFTPVMIRTGDYYVGLRERTKIARDHHADLLISIHADGFKNWRAHGASVFALSRRGATSEAARWLAHKENMADQIGGEDGISLNDKDDQLAKVLLDLSMTSTLSYSIEVGDKILQNLGTISHLHKKTVEQAGFVVLKSPDIPSVLVEVGFLTNPQESKKLKNPHHQKAIATSIFDGLNAWFVQKPPPGTLVAKWKQEGKLQTRPDHYVIQAGDTLSGIASQFDISLSSLRKANKISKANDIRVGRVLVIPN